MKHTVTIHLLLLLVARAIGAGTDNRVPDAASQPTSASAEIAALSDKQYDNAADREQAIVRAALADLEAVKRSPSPMTGWTAQLLLKAGRKEEGLAIVRTYIGNRIKEAKARIANVEKQKKAGTYKPFPLANGMEWGEPHVNGFGLWSMINVYLRYQNLMDERLKADFKWLFTSNTSWAGSTGNLSFLIPLNLYLTENTMRISDGVTERLYDITRWTITERKVR